VLPGPPMSQGTTTMKEFDIVLPRKPSAFAGIAEQLAKGGISIRGISAEAEPSKWMFKLVTDDEASTRSILAGQGISFTEREVLTVVIFDRPGELAKLARKLARRMIQVETMYMLARGGGKTEVAFTATDMAKAAQALKA
jgi:hypothetical protein